MWHFLFNYLLPISFLFFILTWINNCSSKNNQPPSPTKLPIIGNLHQIGSLQHRSLHSLSKKYGHLMLLHFGRKPTLVVSSVEAAREIMKTHDLVFSNRPKSTMADKLLYGSRDVAFAPMGVYWRRTRSICILQLLSNKRVESFRFVREEETTAMIEKIEKSCRRANDVVNLSEIMITHTNNVVCRAALGRKYSLEEDDGTRFKRVLGEFMKLLGSFDVGDYIPWLRWVNYLSGLYRSADRVAKDFDEFLESVVEEHLRREKTNCEYSKDFVDVLLEHQKDNPSGFSLTREGIKAIIMCIWLFSLNSEPLGVKAKNLGHDAIGFPSVQISQLAKKLQSNTRNRHHIHRFRVDNDGAHETPIAQKALQKEVRGVAKENQTIAEDNLEKMPYLKAVMKESLRLHPPIPLLVPRETTKDVKLMGYNIKAGTLVLANAWAIGRDPSVWDEAEVFKPERFLGSRMDFRGRDFELIPFGAGRRGCIGMEFAIRVDELAVANLVRRFDFYPPDGVTIEDLDVDETAGITVHKRVPLRVVANLAPYE